MNSEVKVDTFLGFCQNYLIHIISFSVPNITKHWIKDNSSGVISIFFE